MKFTCSVTINLPRATVIKLFDNPENLKEWQDGFHSFQPLEGSAGEKGSVAEVTYLMGKSKKKMVITETVLKNNLPDEFIGHYHHEHMSNTMKNTFIDLGQQTRYDAEVHYLEFKGFMVKTIAFLFPGMFKKQVQKWLNQFKEFAEKEGNITT